MKEYKVVELITSNVKEVEKLMNNIAREGWEVVSTNHWYWNDSILIIFVRDGCQ